MRSQVLLGLTLLFAIALSGCAVGDGDTGGEVVGPVTASEAPDGEITVSGPVGRVVDLYVFEIDADGGEPILVVAPDGAGPLAPGVEAEVTGTLETFDVAAIQRRTSAPLNPELYRFNGRPCVIARMVNALARPG